MSEPIVISIGDITDYDAHLGPLDKLVLLLAHLGGQHLITESEWDRAHEEESAWLDTLVHYPIDLVPCAANDYDISDALSYRVMLRAILTRIGMPVRVAGFDGYPTRPAGVSESPSPFGGVALSLVDENASIWRR